MAKMIVCKHCGQQIAANAKVCPNCGGKNKQKIYTKWWFWVIIVVIIIAAAAGGGSKKDSDGDKQTSEVTMDTTRQDEAATPDGAEDTKEITEAPAMTAAAEESAPEFEKDESIPADYKNALRSAGNYSSLMHMSKQGIYDQLTSEYGDKFTADAAQYAVDNMEADWNANALASAENYSETMHMSKQGIYDQLISEYGEKFTAEEAQYAVDNMAADWNANALASAKSYQDTMAMSSAAIYDQLISEYGEKFTAEEAQYAVDHLND